MELKIYKDINELMQALANLILKVSKDAIEQRGEFNFVLSGGSSPRKLYELLASEPYKSEIDWSRTYFFFGDERYVPKDDPQRNSLMAERAFLKPLNVNPSQVFKVDTSGSPAEAAMRYNGVIASHFKQQKVIFDFVLLGMGDDAHTASLFPGTSVLGCTEATIKFEHIDKIDMDRITMTAPLINQARNIAFLVYGKDKAKAVQVVLDQNNKLTHEFPAKLISPDNGKLYWFLDAEASSLLDK